MFYFQWPPGKKCNICVKPPLSGVIVFSYTWYQLRRIWLRVGIVPPILFLSVVSLVSVSLESLMYLVQKTATPYPPESTTLVLIFIQFFHLSVLVILSLTNPGSYNQETIILVFSHSRPQKGFAWNIQYFYGGWHYPWLYVKFER